MKDDLLCVATHRDESIFSKLVLKSEALYPGSRQVVPQDRFSAYLKEAIYR